MRRFAPTLVAVLVVIATIAAGALAAGATVRLTNGEHGHDQLMFHGRLGTSPGRSVMTTGMTLDMYNAKKTKTGIALFKMQFNVGKIWFTGYGDLSAATKNMTITIHINGRGYSLVHAYKKTANGWSLTNDTW